MSAASEQKADHLDSVASFLRDLERFPVPSHEEQLDLARRAINGDRTARTRMIMVNLRLVVHWARLHQHRGVDLADLVQEGIFGLMRAVEKFDPERGYRFSTYASWWIRQSLQRAVNSQQHIRLPIGVAEHSTRLATTRGALQSRLARDPTSSELAVAMGTTVESVRAFRSPPSVVASLDQAAGPESDTPIVTFFGARDEEAFDTVAADQGFEELRRAVAALPDLEQAVIRLRFGFGDSEPASLAETARRLGVGVRRARSAEERALAALEADERVLASVP